jgi:hypothetical protein
MSAGQVVTDYASMPEHKMLDAMSDDASRWAAAFCQIAKKQGHDLDEGWMLGWFANAIEHSTMVRTARARPRTEPVVAVGLHGKP